MTTSEDIGVVHAAAGGIVFDRRQVPQPDPAWFEPARWASGEVSGRGGRGAVWRVDTPAGRAVLRHYRRGGLVARLVRDHYLWLGASRTRCRREFDLLLRLRALELLCQVWIREENSLGERTDERDGFENERIDFEHR